MKRKYKQIVYDASVGNKKVMKFYENHGFKMTGYTIFLAYKYAPKKFKLRV